MVNSHGSRHFNDRPNNSRNHGVVVQHKKSSTITKKSPLTTAIVSKIRKCFRRLHRDTVFELTINISNSGVHISKTFLQFNLTESQSNRQSGGYRLSNGKFITSAYQPFTTSSTRIVESTFTAKSTLPGLSTASATTSSSSATKYNFPPRPKKIDFKVATKTQFATAVDSQRK